MSVRGKALRANIAYAVGSGANSIALFILTPYLVNALTPEEYGAWSLFEVGILILNWILLAGLDVGLMREYWFLKDETKQARSAGTALIAVTIWGGVLTGVLGTLSLAENWNWGLPGAPFTIGLAIAIGLTEAVFTLLLTIFRIREQAGVYVTLSTGRMVGFLISSIAFVSTGHGLAGALAGRLLAGVLGVGAAIIWGRRYFLLQPDWNILRRMAHYGLPLLPANLASYVLFASDRYFLGHFFSLEVVGVYSFGHKVAAIVDILLTRPFALDWAPRRFKIATEDCTSQKYARALLAFLFSGAFLGLIVFAVTPAIYGYIAPELYRAGMSVVPVIILAYLIYGLSYPLNVGIMLKDKTYYLPLIGWLAAGGCFLLNLRLIPTYGILGAAWATVFSYGIWTGMITLFSLRLYLIRYPLPPILLIVAGIIAGYLGVKGVERLWGTESVLLLSLLNLTWVCSLFVGIGCILWGKEIQPRSLVRRMKQVVGRSIR